MSLIHCAICGLRISDWVILNGKCIFIGNKLVHKSCNDDHKLKYGCDWKPEGDNE